MYSLFSPGITSNNNNNNNNNGSNGNGISTSFTDKDSLTPSPPQRLNDSDVKSEPMDMVCGSNNNLACDDHSNDSSGEPDGKYMGLNDGKGSLRYDTLCPSRTDKIFILTRFKHSLQFE